MSKARTPEQRRAYTQRQRKYEQTAKGKACLKRHRDKRIFLNRTTTVGIAASAEQAKAINAHIKRRKCEFIKGLSSGAETESVPTSAVRPETTLREDRL